MKQRNKHILLGIIIGIFCTTLVFFLIGDVAIETEIKLGEKNTQDNENVKTLTFSDVVELQGYPTAQTMTMTNHIEESQTQMRILDMEYNVQFDGGFFTERNLKK